ncbi:metallophosphoesterase [Luteolibacter flavescens]|uniref:Metallophosphoesterase n=1 Tax=Luteolibacter flavescens TaxID=1859460 RepID=A0ABT3FVQ2_9BACT|nr:metallophosphoesterase [Luteolibacter flavescens]MCW1887050.1 metallophosphoesterase [Luteolibacter flavescens]
MIRLLHLSDPHFGAADEATAQAFLARAKELAPDLTVLSGDLTMRARRQELRDAKAFYEQLPQPRFVIPGNHDIPALNQPLDRFFRPFRRYRETFGKDLEPSLCTGSIEVIGLNSNRAFSRDLDWSKGYLSQDQLDGAARRFGPVSPGLRVLTLHHPLLAPPDHRRDVVKPLPPLLTMLSGSRVDLVLCGHFHQSRIGTVAGTSEWSSIVSQAPTVCSTRLQGEPPGFHMIHLDGDQLRVVLHRYEGDRFMEDSSEIFRRDETGWHVLL